MRDLLRSQRRIDAELRQQHSARPVEPKQNLERLKELGYVGED
ncbi:MAG: hypothetical protein ACI8X5_000531 [Planctomycetota bacterium]